MKKSTMIMVMLLIVSTMFAGKVSIQKIEGPFEVGGKKYFRITYGLNKILFPEYAYDISVSYKGKVVNDIEGEIGHFIQPNISEKTFRWFWNENLFGEIKTQTAKTIRTQILLIATPTTHYLQEIRNNTFFLKVAPNEKKKVFDFENSIDNSWKSNLFLYSKWGLFFGGCVSLGYILFCDDSKTTTSHILPEPATPAN